MRKGMWACLVLLLMCLFMGALGEETADFTLVDESGQIRLYANTETGEILIMDLRDGYLWRSNPADADGRGVHKMTLLSQITIGYSSDRGTALTALGQMDSVQKKGFSMTIQDGEAISTYDFPKQEIRLSIHYRLKDGCLEASVPVEECVSYGANSLTAVEVLPAFGAAGIDETGYLLLPDGCGALIHFNNGVTTMNEYRASVYGKDPSVTGQVGLSSSPAVSRTYEQTVRLPVFGVSKGNHGFLAIITENDSKAVLHARVSNLTSFNYAYSEFQMRSSGSIIMNRKEFEQSVTGIVERDGLTTGQYTVRYCFLNGEEESGYAGMARVYREYLEKEKGLCQRIEKDAYPLYIDLYGYVRKTAHILGIPYQKAWKLTTVDSAWEIAQALGVDQVCMRYRQFLYGNAYGKVPDSVRVQPCLGSTEDLTALASRMREGGGALFPDVDMMNVYQGGNGFRALYDAVLTPVNSPQMQYQINYASSKLDYTVAPWYLMSPLKYSFFFGRYFDSYEKLGLKGISLSAIGDILTADNRTGGIGRQDAQAQAAAVLSEAEGKFSELMIDRGNAYAAALATHVLQSPGNSSQWLICDQAVPFWQMVFHGYVHYSLSPVNGSGNPNELALQCMEYGASPLYSFVGENQEELMNSRMLEVYAGDWRAWKDSVLKQYACLREVLSPLADRPITGHAVLSPDVRRTDYGDISVYVNYGKEAAVADGVEIPAEGYLVKGGNAQ